jgi:hypothetical protein
MGNERSIYFDINIYRRITRSNSHWLELEKFLDEKDPGLLDNCTVLFTWSQVLEAANLGPMIGQIDKTNIWKQEIEGKKLIDQLGFQVGLNKYFEIALKAVESLLSLQKNVLLEAIDNAISHTCKEAYQLVQNTLLRYREFIKSDNYMEGLSKNLAWAFICSYSFIKSEKQWKERKLVYDSLMAMWHQLFLNGYEIPFFRLCESQYFSYLLYSPDVDMEEAKKIYPDIRNRHDLTDRIFHFSPLKPGGDLCDGEIIHFPYFGDNGIPIVGVTMDGHEKINQRARILERSLIDLKKCVLEWQAKTCLGKIYSLDISNDGIINNYSCILPNSFLLN